MLSKTFNLLIVNLDTFNKVFRHFKTTVGNALPEVVVLTGFVVFEGYVADDTERDERRLVDVADLCNRAALHVDSCCLREVVHNLLHLLTSVDKPLATDGQSSLDV